MAWVLIKALIGHIFFRGLNLDEMKKKINIEAKLLMKLKKFLPENSSGDTAVISIDEGSTLKDLKSFLGISIEKFDGLVLDHKNWELEDTQILNDGDTLTFYPTVGGG